MQRLQDPIAELAYVTLKTASQVWVVYDIPGWQERQRQIRATFSGVAPYIRNRQLVGLVYRGDILYITEARPGRRFR